MSEKEDKNSEKLEQTLQDNPPDERDRIEGWQAEEVDADLHVKYNPNSADSKSQLDAILADVNDDQVTIETQLNKDYYKNEVLGEFSLNASFDIEVDSPTENQEEEYNLSGDVFDEVTYSNESFEDRKTKERKFSEEEKRKRDVVFNGRRNRDKEKPKI